jgi:hypothetical protein
MNDVVDVIQSMGFEVDTLGRALIVCGTAFVCSGLVFLLPGRRTAAQRAFKENIENSTATLIKRGESSDS